jgi:hypothetical protein
MWEKEFARKDMPVGAQLRIRMPNHYRLTARPSCPRRTLRERILAQALRIRDGWHVVTGRAEIDHDC